LVTRRGQMIIKDAQTVSSIQTDISLASRILDEIEHILDELQDTLSKFKRMSDENCRDISISCSYRRTTNQQRRQNIIYSS
jgi:hypothetical protein